MKNMLQVHHVRLPTRCQSNCSYASSLHSLNWSEPYLERCFLGAAGPAVFPILSLLCWQLMLMKCTRIPVDPLTLLSLQAPLILSRQCSRFDSCPHLLTFYHQPLPFSSSSAKPHHALSPVRAVIYLHLSSPSMGVINPLITSRTAWWGPSLALKTGCERTYG